MVQEYDYSLSFNHFNPPLFYHLGYHRAEFPCNRHIADSFSTFFYNRKRCMRKRRIHMGKKTKVALTIAAAGVAAWAGSKAVAKPQVRPEKEALQYGHPIVLAHRGGSIIAPENT